MVPRLHVPVPIFESPYENNDTFFSPTVVTFLPDEAPGREINRGSVSFAV